MPAVIGYHGTSLEAAQAIARGQIEDPADRVPPKGLYRWLGKGLYFFEGDRNLAEKWAKRKFDDNAAVLMATIDLTDCMQLIGDAHSPFLKEIYNSMLRDHGTIKSQKPLTIVDGEVKTAWDREWSDFGFNTLDYAVIEEAVVRYARQGWPVKSVRGLFLEGREFYPTSYLFDESHISIAVRKPYDQLQNIQCFPC